MSRQDGLYYLPLGGAGEIGMNMYLYGLGGARERRWIMVDCGVGFPNDAHAPGVDLMMADPAFIAAEAGRLDAIFITHAHEDHIGAIGHLWQRLQAPIYCTAFPADVARRKMQEHGHSPKIIKQVSPGERVEAGSFSVEFLPVTHSVPETSALVIRTPQGTVLHTADFKLDRTPVLGNPTEEDAFRDLGDEGVLALTCDSTNVFAEGWSGSEADIQDNLRAAIASCDGAVAATTFASNVARLMTLARAAEANERAVVVAGRAMKRMIETAVRTGAIDHFPNTVSEDQARDMPGRNLFYLITGSQGEGRAAVARIANGSHPSIEMGEGDTVLFSSKTIPGNEESVFRIYNLLSERGVRVIDTDQKRIHVSGHARRDELARMYELIRPRLCVPMHGEHRHLKEHARSAVAWGVAHSVVAPNGSLVRLAPGAAKVVDQVEAGRLYLDGKALIGAMDGVVRARRKLGFNGHVTVALVVDEDGVLIADPQIRILGAPETAQGWPAPLEEAVTEAVDEAVERLSGKARRSDGAIEDAAARAARNLCFQHWGKKPETTVVVTRLEDDEDDD